MAYHQSEEFDPNKEHLRVCSLTAKYAVHVRCTCKQEEFNNLQSVEIEKYKEYFLGAGFEDYAIDFSYIDPGIIRAMGEALKAYLENQEK